MDIDTIKKYSLNCFLLTLPIIVWNIVLTRKLPQDFQPEIFWNDIPPSLMYGENISRIVIFILTLLMPLSISSLTQKSGLFLYVGGTLLYFASWVVLIIFPNSGWSNNIIGFTAPANKKFMHKNTSAGIWKYLDELGVLEKGNDDEIKSAKKAYRKKYLLEFKQRQRKAKPEYSVYYSKENGEHDKIVESAKKHRLTPTAFIRQSSLAYIDKKYIVPNKGQIAYLEQLLSDCLNDIKVLVSRKERFFWDREEKINVIEKRIERLEEQINNVFRNPPLVYDRQNQIA